MQSIVTKIISIAINNIRIGGKTWVKGGGNFVNPLALTI